MEVAELSYVGDLLRHSLDGAQQDKQEDAPAGAGGLQQEKFLQDLMHQHADCKLVFCSSSRAHEQQQGQHLSTGLASDHLFLSLLENGQIMEMCTLFAATQRRIFSALRFGEPVCGHPDIVHGGMISALFDETFGVLLYASGRWGQLELSQVFTARLEVDYKKPLPARSTILCTADVESVEGRKIWVCARLTDPSQQLVYAASRALFVKPREHVQVNKESGDALFAVNGGDQQQHDATST